MHTPPPPYVLAASARPRDRAPGPARAFVREQRTALQQGPVCSCHPAGGHPPALPELDIASRDTQKLPRRRTSGHAPALAEHDIASRETQKLPRRR